MKKLELLKLPEVEVTAVSLKVKPRTNIQQWFKIGDSLRNIEGALQWWVGDWLNDGEAAFGEMYAQAVDHVGYAQKTLMNIQWVASRIPASRRRENVSWTKHAEVASLEPKEQEKILEKAAGWTVKQVRAEVKDTKARLNKQDPLPGTDVQGKCPTCGQDLPEGVEV